jgi:HK97 family phage major capsid protein/HK97 family phage prohead protease
MNRAYTVLEVKGLDEDKRIIRGVATTPEPDRVGDIVEPLGVEFKNPMPLLWQHKSDKPVGTVRFDKPTKNGINFEAQIASIDEPGTLKDRLDEAWQSVKLGLVRAVSIGFRSLEHAFMENGGIRFIQSEVMELSLVTIPANAGATIQSVKQFDAEQRAASGRELNDDDRPTPPASGKSKSTPVVKAQEGRKMKKKSTAELITGFEATRAAKAAEMEAIMEASAESGETLNAEDSEKYDTLAEEVKSIDAHLARLNALQASQVKQAKPVLARDPDEASESRGGHVRVTGMKSNVPKGIPFVRMLGAKWLAKQSGYSHSPADIAKQMFPDTPEVEMVLRAPVAPGTTVDSTWASPLVVSQNMASEFVDLLVPATIIGRIPGLRRVPFNITIPRETTGASVGWVGEAAPKPVSAMAFDSISLRFTKVAGIVPISQELMRFSSPAAEGLIRDSLIRAIAYLTDRDFLDPSKAAVTNVNPASITNGVSAVTATGTNADALRADLKTLITTFAAANVDLNGLVLVMTSQQAIAISMMVNTLGQPSYPGIGPNGGNLAGIPVITSENIVGTGGSPTDGGLIVAINAPDILLADDGQVSIDVSTETSLQMESAPDSPATASTTFVSMFQQNLVAIRAERFIHWLKRRSGAVQYIQYAKYS